MQRRRVNLGHDTVQRKDTDNRRRPFERHVHFIPLLVVLSARQTMQLSESGDFRIISGYELHPLTQALPDHPAVMKLIDQFTVSH